MNTISRGEIKAKKEEGMTAEQIAKELISSPTEEVKPSLIKQLTEENEKLKEEIQLAKDAFYHGIKLTWGKVEELKEENEKLKEKLESRKSLCNHFEMLGAKHYEEKEKWREEAKKIEEAVRDVGHVDTISKCNEVWYG